MSESNAYNLEFTESALEDFRRLDKKIGERVFKKLMWLAENADNMSHYALTGQWIGFYRYRIGDYRAIYDLNSDEHRLIIIVIGHRRQIYDE